MNIGPWISSNIMVLIRPIIGLLIIQSIKLSRLLISRPFSSCYSLLFKSKLSQQFESILMVPIIPLIHLSYYSLTAFIFIVLLFLSFSLSYFI